jgi:hypothetical protein
MRTKKMQNTINKQIHINEEAKAMKAGQKVKMTDYGREKFMANAIDRGEKVARTPKVGFITNIFEKAFLGVEVKFDGIQKPVKIPHCDIEVIGEKITWTRDLIIRSYDKYTRFNFIKVVRSLYDFQTKDERASESTIAHNEVGFNGLDAKFAASLIRSAKQYGSLTEKQHKAAKKMMVKYGAQLARIANGRQTSHCI